MKITLKSPSELTETDRINWHQMLSSSELFNPFVTPEFITTTARTIDNVQVLCIEDEHGPVAFLPFQKTGADSASPVGNGLNEFQAAITRPQTDIAIVDWLREAGVKTLSYDHWTTSQEELAPFHLQVGDAPYIDLSQGYEAYRDEAKARTSYVTKVERQQRQLERNVGPVRLELRSEEEDLFQLLLKWKSQQHQDTGVTDIFQFDWVLELLRNLKNTNTPNFRGLFSTLFVDDIPIAVSLSLSTPHTTHVWFPSYNRAFSRYSPGIILFLEMGKALSQEGVQKIDFGPGPQQYKRRLTSKATAVAIGAIDCSATKRIARRTWYQTRQWLRNTPLRNGLAAPKQILSKARQWLDWGNNQPT